MRRVAVVVLMLLVIGSSAIAHSVYKTLITGAYATSDWKLNVKYAKLFDTENVGTTQAGINFIKDECAKGDMIYLKTGTKVEVVGSIPSTEDYPFTLDKLKINNKIYLLNDQYLTELPDPELQKKVPAVN